ncbi:hypothetical protein WKW79_21000 [Variovorax robiniae]|uniref:Peptidase S8/S53 domain-containing protein n=1 Tax=Variovorax robiniae TaxID=1836199 RepID=A0ABU8XBA5_9BURK
MPDPAVSTSFPANCDLYMDWGKDTDYAFVFHDRNSVGLLIQWKSKGAAGEAVAVADSMRIHVPAVYRGGRSEGEEGPRWKIQEIWAITVSLERLDEFVRRVESFAQRIELAAPVAPGAIGVVGSPRLQASGDTLAAVLDDGCAFANARFRNSDGTRVIWLWNQDPASGGYRVWGVNGPSPAADFDYGGQYARDDLESIYPSTVKTQEEAYRATRLVGLRRAVSHGTHVMDLLAGEESWEIAYVQFPQAGIDDPSGLWLKRYALDGLHYVLECAGPKTKTIVANISWGPQTGPHDGSSILETAIDMLVVEQRALHSRTLVVSLPAGNSFATQSHACIDIVSGGEVDWHVPPDGEIPAFIELWWPVGAAVSDAHLSITSPSGVVFDVLQGVNPAPDKSWWAKLKTVGQYAKVLFVVHPTSGAAKERTGQHGRWKLKIPAAPAGPVGAVHVYVARADHNMGARRRAKASYLCDVGLEAGRFCSPGHRHDDVAASCVRRVGTLNGLATGEHTHVAAGYVDKPLASATYSSAGPPRPTAWVKPDYACVTDWSEARPGIRASGVRTGTKVVLVGTSTAAPQLGRMIVNSLPPKPPLPVPTKPVPYRVERVGKGCMPPDPKLVPPT